MLFVIFYYNHGKGDAEGARHRRNLNGNCHLQGRGSWRIIKTVKNEAEGFSAYYRPVRFGGWTSHPGWPRKI